MGSGKTTIGVPLARALERRFVDNDTQLFERAGTTAADLAARDGVATLHDAEAEGLLAALRAPRASVIAAAASTIEVAEVRRVLGSDAFTVWLQAAPAALVERLPKSPTRPFALEDPEHLVARQAEARDHLYARVADLTAESDQSTPAAVVAEILAKLPGDLLASR